MTRRLVFVGVVLSAAACAGAGPASHPAAPPAASPAPSPAAAPPQRGTPAPGADAIHLGPSLLRYLIERRVDIHQQVLGQESSSQLAYRVFATSAIHGPSDTAGYPTTFTLDSIVPDSGMRLPGTINLASARGLTFTGVLRPNGEFHRATPSDSTIAQGLEQLVGTFRDFYPHFPRSGLILGASWTDTLSRTNRSGSIDNLLITAITTSRAAAIVERNGAHSVQIESTSAITLSGNGALGGQPITLQGSGSRHAVEFVAVDGRYLGSESLDSTHITFTFPGQTVPQRLVSHATVKVLP